MTEVLYNHGNIYTRKVRTREVQTKNLIKVCGAAQLAASQIS